jgi:hypothetical protein
MNLQSQRWGSAALCAPAGKLGRAFAEVPPVSLSTRQAVTWAGYPLSFVCALPSKVFTARDRLRYLLWLGESSE